MRRMITYGWPTLLVAAACLGLAISNWLDPAPLVCAAAIAAAALAAGLVDGQLRLGLAALVLGFAAIWWGGARLQALAQSVLVARIGERADALVVVTGPARHGLYSLRLPAEVRRFGDSADAGGGAARAAGQACAPARGAPRARGAARRTTWAGERIRRAELAGAARHPCRSARARPADRRPAGRHRRPGRHAEAPCRGRSRARL